MKKNLLIGVLTLLFSLPVMAQENVKLNLPDGVYNIGWQFIVKDNQFYSAPSAVKKFGAAKLNEWYADKKYHTLFAGEKVREGYFDKIPADINLCNAETFGTPFSIANSRSRFFDKEKIIKGPLYASGDVFIRNGSTMQAVTVPDTYKATPKKIYHTISPEEVARIERLAIDQLFPVIRDAKELARYNFSKKDIVSAKLETLDKIFHGNEDVYIGVVYYMLRNSQGKFRYRAIFSSKGNSVKFITRLYESGGISGMLDVDGCGEDELVISKGYGDEDDFTAWQEIYKRQKDDSWVLMLMSQENRCIAVAKKILPRKTSARN